ncbi:MAG: hypothetical protein IJS10_01660 [Alphaproteobacteria bacterium]|nr:hypothetical protein [Alphaproteobacteria bacterium]
MVHRHDISDEIWNKIFKIVKLYKVPYVCEWRERWKSRHGSLKKGDEHEGTRRGRCSRNAAENPIADKGYDSKTIVECAAKNGMIAVIPSLSNAKISRIYGKELYKTRHIVEDFFLKISIPKISRPSKRTSTSHS